MAAHARLLRRAGHDVRVIAGRGAAEIVPEANSRHPEVEAVARRLAAGEAAPGPFERLRARLCTGLGPLVADRDLVIAHNVLTMPFNLPLAAALGALGRPVLAWTHDLAWVNPLYAGYRRDGWPWSMLHEPLPRTTYVAISRARRREVCATLGLPPRLVPVVGNGVDPAAVWGVGSKTHRLAARGGFAGADPLVLVPVRITRRKRLELALQAADLLRVGRPGLRLVVTGPLGPHSADGRAYWNELAGLRDRLRLAGVVCFLHELAAPGGDHPVGDRAVMDLYRMADAVLLPSESEGFGLPVLEAALSRAPLVCANLPVLREAGAGAFTFPSDAEPEEVATALDRALRSRPAREKLAAARRYSWSSVLARIERVIEVAVG